MRSSLKLGAVAALSALALNASAAPVGIPARVVDFGSALVEEHTYRTFNGRGRELPQTTWRVVQNTGNCCENYLATDPGGTLYDFGGTFLKLSADGGQKWREVRTLTPLVTGEGAVSVAHNGDVVAMTWDPYSGDHIVAFKYDVESEQWYYLDQELHHPFFDRPWLVVVKGPFTIGAVTVPYVSVLISNITDELWYYSVDGLNYTLADNKSLNAALSGEVREWLPITNDPAADYNQPHTESGIAPLAGGGAVSAAPSLFSLGRPESILRSPDLRWARFSPPRGRMPEGRMLSDSAGRLHVVASMRGASSVAYSVSGDGGRSWATTDIDLPHGFVVEDYDFKAHGGLSIAAIAIHAHDEGKNTDQDLVYRFKIVPDEAPKLTRLYYVGDGDEDISSGLSTTNAPRFDFATVAILPNGKIAVSFEDAARNDPSIAIQLTD